MSSTPPTWQTKPPATTALRTQNARVDWLASLSGVELAEERRKAHEPIAEKTHPGTGYRSAAFARWRQGIRQQAVAAESTARAVGLVNEGA